MRWLSKYVSSLDSEFVRAIFIIFLICWGGNYFSIFQSGKGGFFMGTILPDYSQDGIARLFSLAIVLISVFTCIPKKRYRGGQ